MRYSESVNCKICYCMLSLILLISLCTGVNDIPGLTDTTIPRRLGPKRASKIRKLFNLSKEDDVRQYVVRRPLPEREGEAQMFVLHSKLSLRVLFVKRIKQVPILCNKCVMNILTPVNMAAFLSMFSTSAKFLQKCHHHKHWPQLFPFLQARSQRPRLQRSSGW